jgi:Protein of unknown function (DUF3618)
MSTEPSAPLDLAALEADIARHRTSLAANVDELASRLNPRELARTAATDARRSLLGGGGADGGGARPERLIAIAGAAVAVLTVLTLLRRMVRRRATVRP